MKKRIIFHLSLLAIGSIWLLSCSKHAEEPAKKDPCPWPEITTEGLNTFGCKINGKEWVPCVDFNGLVVGIKPIEARLTESDGSNSFSISLSRSVYDSTYSSTQANAFLNIWLRPCAEGHFDIPGHYEIARLGWFPNGSQYGYQEIDSLANNYVFIENLDFEENIISGQFQITLIEKQTGEKVEITDGRFDVTYYAE